MHGTHQPIPKCEVKAVAVIVILMMQVVMNACIDPAPNRMFMKVLRPEFKTRMTIDVIDNLENKEAYEYTYVNWK